MSSDPLIAYIQSINPKLAAMKMKFPTVKYIKAGHVYRRSKRGMFKEKLK